MNKLGRFTFMCTRNNNFSNRSQKGFIAVGSNAAKTQPERPGLVAKGKPNPEFSDFKGRPLPTNPPTYAPQERNPECGKTTCPDNHPWLNIREFQCSSRPGAGKIYCRKGPPAPPGATPPSGATPPANCQDKSSSGFHSNNGSGRPYSCSELKGWCYSNQWHASYAQQLRENCPVTCNACNNAFTPVSEEEVYEAEIDKNEQDVVDPTMPPPVPDTGIADGHHMMANGKVMADEAMPSSAADIETGSAATTGQQVLLALEPGLISLQE